MATPPFKYAIFQQQGPDRVNAYLLRNKSPTQRRTSLYDAPPLVDVLHPHFGLSRRSGAIGAGDSETTEPAAGYGEALRALASRCVN